MAFRIRQQHVFDYQDGDVFGCVADIGWITGHSYVVYGPLANGATTVLFESTPNYPDPGESAYQEAGGRGRFSAYSVKYFVRVLVLDTIRQNTGTRSAVTRVSSFVFTEI